MSFMPQLLVAFGVALVVVVLLLLFRSRAARNRGSHHSVSRGPANLRFVCAGCEGQFNHTRRTLGAWEKGTRRFYCNACHTKWRGSHPTQPIQGDATGATGPHPHTRRAEPAAVRSVSALHTRFHSAQSGSGRGCLGAALLFVAVPTAFVYVVVQYA